MAEVSQVTDLTAVDMLALLTDVSGRLRRLGDDLRMRPEVQDITRQTHIEAGTYGPTAEWYVDAELANGQALSWQLLLYWRSPEWHIESEIRRHHSEGGDTEIAFDDGSASNEDLAAVLRSAVTQLVDALDSVRLD